MRFTHKDVPRGFRVPLGPWVFPPIGAFLCILLMASSSKETGMRLGIWLAIGQVIYFCYGYWNSKLRHTQPIASMEGFDNLGADVDAESKRIEYSAEMEVFNEKPM